MKKFVASVLVILCATLIFAEGQAVAQDYVFKYANTQSDTHPRSKSMMLFKEKLEGATDGRIKVELYFSGVLGKEAEVLDMVKMGTVQGCRGGLFERANLKFLLYTLPFMFENTDQVLKLMASEFGDKVNEGALENGFYIPATGAAGGFRNITNNLRPIETVEDLKGMKMRTPPIDMTIKTFEALGANPQMVAYTETYMALKQGVVDGQENPFSNTVDMKFYEVQKYLSVVNWQLHPDPFYVNPEWYNSLPDDLKKAFDAAAKEAMEYSNKIWLESENDYFKTLEENLEVNTLTSEGRVGFVEAVKPVWQSYVDDGSFTWDDINEALAIAQGE
jgi:tripartite ATP-independent transporter DctP family solute receptor